VQKDETITKNYVVLDSKARFPANATQCMQRKERRKRNERNSRKKRKFQPTETNLSSFQLNSFLRFKWVKKNLKSLVQILAYFTCCATYDANQI